MGVFGLWDILLTIARKCSIEDLSGKILAIDASIWIVKTSSLFDSSHEKLKCILDKIVFLKKHNILPVFVFDGVAPPIKRKTLEGRRRKRIITNDLEVKKKAEIDVIKKIENINANDQKINRQKRTSQKMDQINKSLSNLMNFQNSQQALSAELIQKLRLQSQILTSKYSLMIDIDEQLKEYEGFLQIDDFNELDIESKQQYLQSLEQYKWKYLKIQKNKRQSQESNLSQQEKVLNDLQILQKKSTIRELQDHLYRKTMQNFIKQENGYEIIEGIYNGKKVIQKRKIIKPEERELKNKKKMKNDLGSIMRHRLNQEREQREEEDGTPDAFLAQFCSFKVQKSNSNSNFNKSSTQSQNSQLLFQKDKQQNQADSYEHQEEEYQKIKKHAKIQKTQKQEEIEEQDREQESDDIYENKDKLPRYIDNQALSALPSSNDNLDLQNLLTILGIPFIISPSEAEAECADLEQSNLVDGIITEDSDVFLFGGRNVFRGVFQNNIKHYSYDKISEKLKLNRQKLIIFAMLLGSDYTDGVKGIGVVNAMQVLKVFNKFEKLEKFKKWAMHSDLLLSQEDQTSNLTKFSEQEEREFFQMHKRYKNYWFVDPSFPKRSVIDAYLNPQVIDQARKLILQKQKILSAHEPKLFLFEDILKNKLKMHQKQIAHYLKSIQISFKRDSQATLASFLNKGKEEIEFASIQSKRLMKSLK